MLHQSKSVCAFSLLILSSIYICESYKLIRLHYCLQLYCFPTLFDSSSRQFHQTTLRAISNNIIFLQENYIYHRLQNLKNGLMMDIVFLSGVKTLHGKKYQILTVIGNGLETKKIKTQLIYLVRIINTLKQVYLLNFIN